VSDDDQTGRMKLVVPQWAIDRYRTEGDCGFDLVAERPIKIPVEKRAPPAGNRLLRRALARSKDGKLGQDDYLRIAQGNLGRSSHKGTKRRGKNDT
jgi:hypothetical protein